MANLGFDIFARDRNASRNIDKVGQAADRTGKRFGHLNTRTKHMSAGMRVSFGAVATAMGAVATISVFKSFIGEASEARRVGRLTEAVVKSTGGAANVTAKHVARLAESMSNKVAVDDEMIQAHQNLLLTFTGVRNEAGKTNKIFDRASKTIVDMTAAMNNGVISQQGLKSATIQVGKALNDPIKGMTALSKVGVTFTEGQKKQIKALVESGDKLGAQKVILRELSKEFGGAAAASADPMKKLTVVLGNAAEKIGTALLPHIDKAATWLGKHLPPAIDKATKWFKEHLAPAFEVAGDAISWVWKNILQPTLEGIGWAIGHIPEALQFLHQTWTDVWSGVGKVLASAGIGILQGIQALVEGVTWMAEKFVEAGSWIGIFSDEQEADFKKWRRGVSNSFGSAIDDLRGWKRELDNAPKIVVLKGKIDDLDKKIKDAEKKIKSIPKDKRTDFKANIEDLKKKRAAAQREINKLEGKTVTVGLKSNIGSALLSGLGFGGGKAAGGKIPGPASNVDNHLRPMATGEFVVRANKVNARTLPVLEMINKEGIPPQGLAKGGAVGRVNYLGSPGLPQIASQVRTFGAVVDSVAAKIQERATALASGPGRALGFAKAQVGKPYEWGGVGPHGYDCSGFMSAILNVIQGRNPYSRRGTTGTFPWPGFSPGMGGFAIGSTRNAGGGIGHMAGSLFGVPVESRGGVGPIVGRGALSATSGMFGGPWHVKTMDRGGTLPPKSATLAINKMSKSETVFPGGPRDFGEAVAEALVRKMKANGLVLVAVDSGQRANLLGRAG